MGRLGVVFVVDILAEQLHLLVVATLGSWVHCRKCEMYKEFSKLTVNLRQAVRLQLTFRAQRKHICAFVVQAQQKHICVFVTHFPAF